MKTTNWLSAIYNFILETYVMHGLTMKKTK